MALVGGSGAFEGYLYATNPVSKIYGPVCDDFFTINSVSQIKMFLAQYLKIEGKFEYWKMNKMFSKANRSKGHSLLKN